MGERARAEHRDVLAQPLVSYAVAAVLWGRGYATEMAHAAADAAMRLGLPEIAGFTLTTNHASQRVLAKLGVRHERNLEHTGLPL